MNQTSLLWCLYIYYIVSLPKKFKEEFKIIVHSDGDTPPPTLQVAIWWTQKEQIDINEQVYFLSFFGSAWFLVPKEHNWLSPWAELVDHITTMF